MQRVHVTASSKLPLGIAIVLLCCLFTAVLLLEYNRPALYPFFFGLFFGYVMQRSRFCFAACFRDAIMLRSTGMTRALLLALAIGSAGFAATQQLLGYNLAQMGRVYPVGFHTLTGGFLFGLGMVVSGACVAGCLVRMGEGYLMQVATFAGLIVGSLLGAWNVSWWMQSDVLSHPAVFLPARLGWPSALLLQFGLLTLLFALTVARDRNSSFRSIFQAPGQILPYGTAAVLLSTANVAMLIINRKPWSVTGGITHAAGWLAWRIGIPVFKWPYFSRKLAPGDEVGQLLSHPLFYLALAMLAGSLLAGLLHREWRVRHPRSKRYYAAGLSGGILMGYGSRLAFGCNIGALMSGISSFSLHGWIFAFALLPGAAVGGQVLLRYLMDD
jgi:uncharacterized protein